jgi:hypothetical protein
MLIGRVNITSTARRTFGVGFPWLQDTEKVIGVSVDITPDDGKFTTYNIAVNNTGDRVSYQVSGNGVATDGDEYTATITVQTSEQQVNDDCVIYTISCGGCC